VKQPGSALNRTENPPYQETSASSTDRPATPDAAEASPYEENYPAQSIPHH